jgi:hypothetical protein
MLKLFVHHSQPLLQLLSHRRAAQSFMIKRRIRGGKGSPSSSTKSFSDTHSRTVLNVSAACCGRRREKVEMNSAPTSQAARAATIALGQVQVMERRSGAASRS